MICFLFCLLLFIRRSGQKTFFKNKKRQNLEVFAVFFVILQPISAIVI